MVFEIFPDSSIINILGNSISLSSLVLGIIIIVMGIVIARIVSTIFRKYLAANLPGNVPTNAHKILYYGIIAVTLLVVVSSQGIDLSGLMVAGGIFGIIIGFAAQSVVSNMFSGIFLMFDKPAKIGDLIEITQSNIYGKLMEITIFSTRIKLFDGSIMRVPNEEVFTSEIRNISGSEVRRLEFTLGIGYKEDIDRAIIAITNAVENLPYVLLEPKPEIWTEKLADSSIELKILTWIPRDEWDSVGPIILKEIKKEIDNSGIEIPFPQRVIHYSDSTKGLSDLRRAE